MSNYSIQGNISIKRLRNGDLLFLTLENNGRPLFQTYDEQSGDVRPNWKDEANQPILTPKASTTRNAVVKLSNHAWTYNGVVLQFNGEASGDYMIDSTGKFAINPSNGALKIIDNLASADNIANDTLVYSCVATVVGLEYNLTKSIDIQIVKSGASSFFGFIIATTTQLDNSHDKTTLSTKLWLAGNEVSSYYVKWYKGNEEWKEKAGLKSIEVTRNDVSGSRLFIAEFYMKETDSDYVFRAGLSIIDTLDEIMVVPYISSANKEVDTGKPVIVTARIVKASNNTVLTPSSPSWKFTIMDGDTWENKGESTDTSIEVNTTHTDQEDGSTHDVVVLVDVSFDSLT